MRKGGGVHHPTKASDMVVRYRASVLEGEDFATSYVDGMPRTEIMRCVALRRFASLCTCKYARAP